MDRSEKEIFADLIGGFEPSRDDLADKVQGEAIPNGIHRKKPVKNESGFSGSDFGPWVDKDSAERFFQNGTKPVRDENGRQVYSVSGLRYFGENAQEVLTQTSDLGFYARMFHDGHLEITPLREPNFVPIPKGYRKRQSGSSGRSHIRNYRPEIPYSGISGQIHTGEWISWEAESDLESGLDRPRYARKFSDEYQQSRPKIPWRDMGANFRKPTPPKDRNYKAIGAINRVPSPLPFGMEKGIGNPFGVPQYKGK